MLISILQRTVSAWKVVAGSGDIFKCWWGFWTHRQAAYRCVLKGLINEGTAKVTGYFLVVGCLKDRDTSLENILILPGCVTFPRELYRSTHIPQRGQIDKLFPLSPEQ